MRYWRINVFINASLKKQNRESYVEIGPKDNRVIRRVEAHDKYSVSRAHVHSKGSYNYDMSPDDFFDLVANEFCVCGVVFLRDWNNGNIMDRVKECYKMLAYKGVLIIENVDPEGVKDETWRVLVSLHKEGCPVSFLKGRYAVIEAQGILGSPKLSRIKRETYLKKYRSKIREI